MCRIPRLRGSLTSVPGDLEPIIRSAVEELLLLTPIGQYNTHTQTCTYTHTYTYTHIHRHTCSHTPIYKNIYTICKYLHTQKYNRLLVNLYYSNTHTHTHTHTNHT